MENADLAGEGWTVCCGDALELLRWMPSGSVDCIVTSPPYWGLRDYGVAGQLGAEAEAEDYISKLVVIFDEARRVLSAGGTLWLNLGDTYKNKELQGIPWRVALALGARNWLLRQEIIWHKPNALPEPARDRFGRNFETIFFLVKSPNYFFNKPAEFGLSGRFMGKNHKQPRASNGKLRPGQKSRRGFGAAALRGVRSVWSFTVGASYRGAGGDHHIAAFPVGLAERCARAGCPRGGLVLDPFAGASTTGVSALRAGRQFLGLELNPVYCQLSAERLRAEISKKEPAA